MKKSNWHSLKTQQQTLLLRRPLPPKLPKLPLREEESSHRFIISKLNKRSAESRRVLKTPDFGQELPFQRDVDKVLISPIPSTTSVVPEPQWAERPAHRPKAPVSKVVMNVASLPEARSLPKPALPRKPPRQTAIENAAECGKVEVQRPPDTLIRSARKIDPDAHVLQGEGFKTTAATRYETVMAMTTLAIINCQIYGRNALNLKGFFLQHCPDLTALAVQLLYLNLSFNNLSQFPMEVLCLRNLQVLKLRNNPIREIPSEIQQLKYLRNFCISFNFITELPAGLFCLNYLEELDVSYNEISDIPNDIQKLRSLQKLNVDGNYMNSFPPGILKLNLNKLHFENTFTSSYFWLENSLNDAPRLTDICSLFIVKSNLHKVSDFIPEKVQKYLKSEFMCDWCHGPRFGEGFHIIRSCETFGASHLPIMFRVCSPACYVEIRGSSFVLQGFPSRKIALNMDWVKESRIGDVSFYL